MAPRPERAAICVLVVDDHEVVLHGLAEFFGSQPDMKVVGQARSAEEALRCVAATKPDIAVLDLRLPDMDGISLCREIRAAYPDVICLMLSSFADENAVLEAMIGGAVGYVLKEAPLGEVADAVRQAAEGKSLMDPALMSRALRRLEKSNENTRLARLSTQERRVLDLLAQAATNRDIAEQLHLAEQTVKNYVSSILSKLGLQGRTQAALFAAELRRAHQQALFD